MIVSAAWAVVAFLVFPAPSPPFPEVARDVAAGGWR